MNYASIKSSIANIYSKPSFKSELITQAFIFEKVKINNKKDNWYFIEQSDNYVGWIHKFYLSSEIIKVNAMNRKFSINIYESSKLIKNICIIPFSAEFKILEKKKLFSIISLYDSRLGYIKNNNKFIEKNQRLEIAKLSMIMLNTPYLWGGKSIYGYDCSGFVQTIFKAVGIQLPRDSKKQYTYIKKINRNKICKEPKSGDLIFFSKDDGIISHVAIYLKEQIFIHSSGSVKINSFNDNDLIFDFKLNQFLISIYSIDSILNQIE